MGRLDRPPAARTGPTGQDAPAARGAPAPDRRGPPAPGESLSVAAAATLAASEVTARLHVDPTRGLSRDEVLRRRARWGPNAVATHRARLLPVLWRQVRSPLLGLLLAAAVASYFVGERTDAVIIGVIVTLSVGLGLVNEYRAEQAAEALHDQVRHRAVVVRDGTTESVDVRDLVPGDLVHLGLGDLVPADLRLLEVSELACDEAVLTGEAEPVGKRPDPVAPETPLAELASCALMGTIVTSGNALGVVVGTGARTEFGTVAAGLATRHLETEFERGLRRFSVMLVWVAGALTSSILVINVILQRPFIDALLFSLAIAVGITPQLLPAVVSTSLAAGSAQLRQHRVLVKRLVCIEDLGDIDTVFTDKTGTLTEGRIRFARVVPCPGIDPDEVLLMGLLATESPLGVGNALDTALWESAATARIRDAARARRRIATLPFDHERRMVSVLLDDEPPTLVTKGAPEAVLGRCVEVPASMPAALDEEFRAGNRVVAVGTRPMVPGDTLDVTDEAGLRLVGLLVFHDPPKSDAREALGRLESLGIDVKVVTGDNPIVALKVCRDLGLGEGALTGPEMAHLDDEALAARISEVTVFARVSPEDKSRIVRVRRRLGGGVAFLGDGVNDALALHSADVGISVDTATDVAKDAADILLLEKSLDVLADGVAEGRRIFANTTKYVLMGTSSNFGNMFSAAGASIFLTFLPMLPSQILLGNLLYDSSQLTIPTDRVDEEQLRRPSHWDIGFIRRFMVTFGPLSSLFDFATFAVMLWGFHAGPELFRSGWFVESLATQTLVIFVIRTRRVPFFRSRPSVPLALSVVTVATVGAVIPATPLAGPLGFTPLPWPFFAALAVMVLAYLALIEIGKVLFYRTAVARAAHPAPPTPRRRRVRRRASRFTTTHPRQGSRRRPRGGAEPARDARRA
ncbi:magnesium ABC transporter ATPase [Intrasporangium oryzae NRRL B-24470]|uniref:Magnesium-transporting ATPase, P-type 1 n=1 Tax=Intrasporangium oryzae NRRL B-24470 TaxID=1386089 RepID=W9GE85_9MICO|nr:magnesium-translocating P-type ATPase [Intrasporangium oryzae]EWT03138.1 magnesium ABC transporter ATPase [Intrasporangium oryzae NRRL B-24470]